jgi:hypothetical protein
MLTSVDARRRWFGSFFLILSGGLLAWGLTLLEPALARTPWLFVAYWLACFGCTAAALGIAVYDLFAVRRRLRREKRAAFERAFGDALEDPPSGRRL